MLLLLLLLLLLFWGGGEEEGRGRGRELQKRKNKQNGAADVLEDLLHQPPVLVALLDDEADLFLLCESEQVRQSCDERKERECEMREAA